MAATFRSLVESIDPAAPTLSFGAALALFETNPAFEFIPVITGDTLVGTLSRLRVYQTAASDLPRDKLLSLPIAPLLDPVPATADVDQKIGGYAARTASEGGKALAVGLVVLEDGGYLGVVRPAILAAAVASENARRAKAQKKLVEQVRTFKQLETSTAENAGQLHAMLAHELRTPLHAAQASVDLLQAHSQSTDGRALARTVADACVALDRLLDDLMTVSRADLGNLPINPEPVSLKRLIADVERLWAPRCSQSGIDLSLELGKLAAERVEIDPVRLRQVIDNLLSNAVKYTERGGVTVVLSTAEEADGLLLSIDIGDTGPGLSGDALKGLFEPFSRLSGAEHVPGSGLGLALTRAVTEHIGGTVSYRTRHSGGSVFSVSIPVRKAGPRIIAENRKAPVFRQFTPGDLLIVDDHEPSRLVLAKALSGAGWRVDGVSTREQALRRLGHKPYQAILCDLHLPDGDGADVLDAERRRSAGDTHTPVIAVTADHSEEKLAACAEAGFDATWTKPIKPGDVIMLLAEVITGVRAPAPGPQLRSAMA
ncbi:MAG: ATP-binding protein [Pseudomonadota bacterium]